MTTNDALDVRWIRHGQSTANLVRRFSYKGEPHPLTELGQLQARALTDRLAREGLRPRRVFCSPLLRAHETAAHIARRFASELVVLEDLRELNVGDLDGHESDEHWHTYFEVVNAWHAGDLSAAFPSGESALEVATRVQRAYEYVLDHHIDHTTLIVAHGGNIDATMLALDPANGPVGHIDNCGSLALRLTRAADGFHVTRT